jgi:hypothetical protein
VVDDATPWAVEYAGSNPNADRNVADDGGTYVEGERDVKFGKATFDADGCNCWTKTPADEVPADDPNGNRRYFNYVEVTPLRNQGGSGAEDGPVPLLFAKILGMNEKSVRATATAAILPSNGYRVNEGSDDTANVMPFAFKEEYWERYRRAQEYYDDHPGINLNNWNTLQAIKDTNNPVEAYRNEPLFGALDANGNPVQLFYDNYTRTAAPVDGVNAGTVSNGADNVLEVDIYPRNLKHAGEQTSGNFGTVDFGSSGNSTSELDRQIREGLNEDDLSHFDNNEIVLSDEDPLDTGGDTGVSGGIKDALDAVKGECKAIALYTSVSGSGNNTNFRLVKFVGATVVRVKFSGNPKELRIQPCTVVDDNGVPDTTDDGEIDEDDTTFTNLILIR